MLPVYVGLISDVELTCTCGFLEKPNDKPGIPTMADRRFTVKDMFKELIIDLNISPFFEGRTILPTGKVDEGRKIASLHIHVEQAIGRKKIFSILKHKILISMARLTNQIVFACAFLTNLQHALIPQAEDISNSTCLRLDSSR